MSSNFPGGDPSRRQSIPLQNLDGSPYGNYQSERLAQEQPQQPQSTSLTEAQMTANLSGISTYWEQPYHSHYDDEISPHSPIDPMALQAALPPDLYHNGLGLTGASADPFDRPHAYVEDAPGEDIVESDRVPLTAGAQPISGSLTPNRHDDRPRDSFQTVSSVDNSPSRNRDTGRSLGQDLDANFGAARHRSYGASLNPNEYRRSRSPTGALSRAGSIVRAMSQRVVNLSGESELVDQRVSRHRSQSPHAFDRNPTRDTASMLVDTSYQPQVVNPTAEKTGEPRYLISESHPSTAPRPPLPNPLKGKSLGLFSPDNFVRRRLCDLLVNPYTEPFLLLLIVLQAILLAVEAAPPISADGEQRPERWKGTAIDWAMLVLFIIFTLELISRIIVSGFILNAAEFSTIDRKRGIRAAVADQYRVIFQPERQKSVKNKHQFQAEPSTIARSFTTFMQGQQALPQTLEEQQRFQLARRAFLRHSFNRIDFVAVVSFWIMFYLSTTGLETKHHLFVFRMMSCLRILRLLSLTNGTAIILRSLKKAAPLLVRVAFLLSFFWLLFAIIGVQSFKASLSRQCVWLDPLDPKNLSASYTNSEAFCGGFLDNETGETKPWVMFTVPDSLANLEEGTSEGKGFLCPRGSICLQQTNPFGGTVNFDNIFNSLELVFVIMSANTFSDLMYYTMGSDYSQAALFFGAGIMIMMLWLTNLLIAVITSSFQVIREESKASAFTVDQEPFAQPRPEERLRLWVVIIAFGLVCQACRSSTMSHWRETFINNAEVVVTILLDIELIVRFTADWNHFHKSWRNIFDLGLAVITSIILIPPIRGTRAYDWLTIFQILRAYRVVLAIPVTRQLIQLVLGNATGIANLMFFVFLMTFMMAIFAVQLFRGEIPIYDDGELNRISFYQIFNSFMGMYQVLTSENWTEILYTVTLYTRPFQTSWIGAILLIGWFIVAFFILVNMFIAVIQENFDVSEDEKRLQQVKAFLQRRDIGNPSSHLALSTIFTFGKSRRHKDPLDYGPATMEMLLKDAVVREFLEDNMDPLNDPADPRRPLPRSTTTLLGNDVRPGFMSGVWGKFVKRVTHREPNPFYSNLRFDSPNDTQDPRQMAQQAVSATSARRRAQREYLARNPTYNNSLYIFKPDNSIRRLCQQVVGPARGPERFDGLEPNRVAWYTFTIVIYASIVAMVVLACVTTPLYQKEYQQQHGFSIRNWYIWTDMAFAVVFTVEALIKIIADGLIWTPNAFLRSSWGLMDAVVLITLWINVVTLLINDGAISRAIGAFKALRALRLLNVSNSARNTFHDLIIVGWWKILGAAFVSLSLLIPFAIYGLNLFNGLMQICNDGGDGISTMSDCFGEYDSEPFSDQWPMLAPRVAANPFFNFDDFGSSLFILFQIVSQEGWTDVSFASQAITGRNSQPSDLASQGNALFFVAFNLLATVFVLTLFISVFMRNYTEQTGVAFLTAEQRSWLELRKILRQISPSKSSYDDSEKSWKKWCHKRAIEKRGKWYQTITVVLVLHLGLLVSEFSDEPLWWTHSRDYVFFAFITIYMSNIAIRIIGLGWARFRRSSWDVYSLLIVSGAFIATLTLIISSTKSELYAQLHKVFLVGIVLLLIPRNDALDQLFKTAAASLTVIGNLLATWLVVFLVFAIAMTQAFSLTRFGESETNDVNFRTVPKALILLFRMSLGEGWNQVMEEYANIEPPLCVEEAEFFDSDCGSKSWARFLFIAWNIVSMYIFVNLFVSLIYESFSYVYQRSSGMAVVDRDEIRRFKEAWRSVDPAGTGYITKEAFPRLLGELSGVFQMRIYDPDDSVRSILEDVQNDAKISRHMSIATTTTLAEVDLEKLNRRIAELDVVKIRERRRRFNVFYEEIMVSADPDRGISFTTVLMILAHYNIISDNKSLKLEEFLRRRARLQRVEEQVRRRIVLGFFDTLYWSRKFKQKIQMKKAARMTGIPRLDIPDIMVEEDESLGGIPGGGAPRSPVGPSSPHSSVGDGQRQSWLGATDLSLHDTAWQHPLSFPRAAPPSTSHHATPSSFSFELQEPDGYENAATADTAEPTSAVSPSQVRGMLDDSVWVESIRRSATVRRSQQAGQYRYGDLE
ncbi:Ion transport protein-domain-containing protein [Dactylonectria estremocensis]|uniref:Calcium-channel protein CCH1 n=1 Tax=Dactylonectria estremocensis TaxID=1079267 RepID=A0A9P9FEC8_9HYPO|nr:Ion transport protein-domain-containing protein [Dactylonectria estremocensis]